jgi:hypothetical protein
MPLTDKVTEELAKLKQKRAKLKAKELILESRKRAHMKRYAERKWYLIGETVSREAERNSKIGEWLQCLLERELVMERDRALFGLEENKPNTSTAEDSNLSNEGTA